VIILALLSLIGQQQIQMGCGQKSLVGEKGDLLAAALRSRQ
jgi:hypothetical protein